MSRTARLSEEARQWCIDHFHELSVREMAEHCGAPFNAVRYALRKAGLSRTKEESGRFRAESVPQIRQKLLRLYKMERFRAMSGQPRQTRLKLAKITSSARSYKTYMCKRFDYFGAEDDASVVCYDDQTRRSPHAEARAATHGLKVVPADE